jgi:hypothetical protein
MSEDGGLWSPWCVEVSGRSSVEYMVQGLWHNLAETESMVQEVSAKMLHMLIPKGKCEEHDGVSYQRRQACS